MSLRLRSNLLFALLCWTWGSTWLAIKLGLTGVPPVIGACLRMTCSGLLLLLLALVVRLRWPTSRRFLFNIPIQGCGQFGLNFALVYWAEQTVPSGLASVLFAISPIVTATMAVWLFRMESLNALNVMGLVLGFAGVAVIYWSEVIQAAHASSAGVAAVMCASVLVSFASIWAKRFGAGIPPLALAAPGQLFGGALLGCVAWIAERHEAVHLSPQSIASVAYLAVLGSAVAFLAYFYLLSTISVTRLSLIGYVTPIVAVTLGAIVLHERLAVNTFVGAALVFAGIGMMYRRSKPLAPEALAA